MAELSVTERMTAAAIGSMLVAMTITPLDVAKVKMQATEEGRKCSPCDGMIVNKRCRVFLLNDGIMEHQTLKSKWPCFKSKRLPTDSLTTYNILRETRRLEGMRGVYAGFLPTLLMSVPNNILYFAAYESIRNHLTPSCGSTLAPIISGGSARFIATFSVAPFEYIRTRMQAGIYAKELFSSVSESGVHSLWQGVVPTLWRDIPFSAIYWVGYESISRTFFENKSTHSAFIAGGVSGSVAALVTMPFDVVKTRVQVQQTSSDGSKSSLIKTLRTISRVEGISALFAGLSPRVSKATLSCAIMISAYETAKICLQDRETLRGWPHESDESVNTPALLSAG